MLSVCVCVCVHVCVSPCVHVGGCMFVSVKEMKAMENSRTRMWCEVPFHLPDDIEVIWRFAEEVRLE